MPYIDNPNSSEDISKGQNDAKSLAKTAGDTAKKTYEKGKEAKASKDTAKAAKEAATSSEKKEGLIALFEDSLGTEALLPILIALILILIPTLLLSAMPIGNLFQDKGRLEANEEKLYKAIESAYAGEERSAKNQIKNFVNSNYSCSASNGDITQSGSTYTVDTDTCYITASFSPALSSMKQNISAYVNAVNGTIAYFGEETDSEVKAYESGNPPNYEKYEGDVIDQTSGNAELTDDARKFYEEHSDELTNTLDEDYIASLNVYSSDFFVYDENEERWRLNNFHIGPKTHQELMQTGTEEVEVNGVIEEVPVYDWVDVTVDAWYGDIGILIFYDLSGYKADELETCVRLLEEKDSKLDAYLDASSVVNAVLNEYYASYIGSFNGYLDDEGNFVLGTDNRDELFKELLADGTLMYVPISGLSSNFLEGEAGYSGEVIFNGYTDLTSYQIWSHINALRKEGVIGYRTSMWNCTAFAQSWFYELYGVNALYGNGRDMVNNLLSENNELVGDWGAKHFYRGSSPAPGGIFSIGSPAGANHVGCVDSVDYENKTITFSDGNTNGAANSTSTISIRRTKTFDEFAAYVKASCAHHGSTAGCWVTYANPNKE